MPDEPIHISWDEVNSPEVDQKVKQQELVGRAQEHYQRQAPLPAGAKPVSQSRRSSFWYNALVYMALFGMVGGVVGWVAGEIVGWAIPDRLEVYKQFLALARDLDRRVVVGQITSQDADASLEAFRQAHQDDPYLQVLSDPTVPNENRDSRSGVLLERDKLRNQVQQIIWFCMIAAPLAFFLSIADHAVSRNGHAVLINGSMGVVFGLLGGVLVGLFINNLYSAILGEGGDFTRQVIARTIGWAILGILLAVAPGLTLRSGKRLFIGMAGGFLGGTIGGMLFDPLFLLIQNDKVSRLIAIMVIGVVAGAGSGWIEAVAKSGWLRVVGGLIVGKEFVIYRNPTCIGSSPQCEIYLFKDPQVGPQHAAIHTVTGGFELEDLRSPTGTLINGRPVSRSRLRNNDQIQIGATTLLYHEKEKGAG